LLSNSTHRSRIQFNQDLESGMCCAPTIEKKSNNPWWGDYEGNVSIPRIFFRRRFSM
jgi:hypothetical protein